jgi:hypothetical protein
MSKIVKPLSGADLELAAELRHSPEFNLEVHTLGLAYMEKGLAGLVAKLDPAKAKGELKLRKQYLSIERSLFQTGVEKGEILLQYKALYEPLRKWTAFCRIVNVPLRNTYNLMAAALIADAQNEVADPDNRAKLARLSGSKEPRNSPDYDFDTAVEMIITFANRIMAAFTDSQRQQALAAVVDLMGMMRKPVKSEGRPAVIEGMFIVAKAPVEQPLA